MHHNVHHSENEKWNNLDIVRKWKTHNWEQLVEAGSNREPCFNKFISSPKLHVTHTTHPSPWVDHLEGIVNVDDAGVPIEPQVLDLVHHPLQVAVLRAEDSLHREPEENEENNDIKDEMN